MTYTLISEQCNYEFSPHVDIVFDVIEAAIRVGYYSEDFNSCFPFKFLGTLATCQDVLLGDRVDNCVWDLD